MTASFLISVFALVLSALSFAVNLWVGRRATIRGRKPVLVFIDELDASWTIRNIGNGPALNVLVAQRQSGQWFNPVRVRPLAKDQTEPLAWLGGANDTGLGAMYSDSEGMKYTSTLGNEVAVSYEGHRLPNWKAESEIRRYWELGAWDPSLPRWGQRDSTFPA